jgi:hypothetical protein
VRAFAILVGSLLCAVELTSCSSLPFGRWGGDDEAHVLLNERMQEISDAVNGHDARALKAMFSPAPRTPSGDSGPEVALFTELDSFDAAASAPPGVFIAS